MIMRYPVLDRTAAYPELAILRQALAAHDWPACRAVLDAAPPAERTYLTTCGADVDEGRKAEPGPYVGAGRAARRTERDADRRARHRAPGVRVPERRGGHAMVPTALPVRRGPRPLIPAGKPGMWIAEAGHRRRVSARYSDSLPAVVSGFRSARCAGTRGAAPAAGTSQVMPSLRSSMTVDAGDAMIRAHR